MKLSLKSLAIASVFAAITTPLLAAEKTLSLGLSDALTGGGAVYGVPQKRAIDLAIEEINTAGGVKVGGDVYKLKTIEYDDKADSTEAANVARKLIDRDGVKYLLGYCCSASGGAVASFIGREDVIMLVGTAGARAITAAGAKNVFRTRPPGDYTGAAAGRFIAQQGVKTLGVLGVRDVALFTQYRDALIKSFEEAGGKVVAVETFGGQDRDMTAQLTKLRGLSPDALFISGYVEQTAFAQRQAHELGIKVPRLGFSGGSAEQFLKVATNEQMQGTWDLLAVEFNEQVLGPKGVAYAEKYRKKYSENPTPNSAFAYDQVYVLRAALQKAGTVEDLEKVKSALRELTVPEEVVLKYLPVKGRMFDGKGQAYISNGAFQWKEGGWTFVTELPSNAEAYSEFLKTVRN
jgi:branched-chain amino acid transport system substrate-binding protein